jgi:hemoglobin-like flavoprotein
MDEQTITLIETSFSALAPRGEELVSAFYDALFEAHPTVRPMFSDDMTAQKGALLGALVLTVNNLRKPDVLLPTLRGLGARHAGYGVEEAHYVAVRDTLLGVMAELAGELWSDELAAAWSAALDVVGSTMLEGAAQA